MSHSEVARTVVRHRQKTEEYVVPQWLGWSSHSLAYEFTQLLKTSHATFHGHSTCSLWWPTPCGVCSSLNPNNPPLTYHCVSHWIFAMRHQSLNAIRSWSQAPWVLAGLKSQEREAEGQEEKTVIKNMRRNPLHNLLENLLNTWPLLKVFISLILGTKKINDRRTPTSLGNSYWGQQIVEPLGHTKSSTALIATHLFEGGLMKQETRDCKGIKILLGICPSSHRSKDLLP